MNLNDVPIVCDLTAIPAEQRATHQEVTDALLSQIQGCEALPDGYALRLAATHYDLVTRFIANERRCCPFITFTLEVHAANGPLVLRMTGRSGVKELLAAEFKLT